MYLCYGIHEILNVAAGAEGSGQGVMFRGVESVVGPGRVTKILGVDRSFNYEYIPKSDRIWIEEGAEIAERNIEKLKRVGIDFADQKDKERLWRFRLITKPPQNLG